MILSLLPTVPRAATRKNADAPHSAISSTTATTHVIDGPALLIAEATRRGHSRDEIIAELSTGQQESGWRMVWDPSYNSGKGGDGANGVCVVITYF